MRTCNVDKFIIQNDAIFTLTATHYDAIIFRMPNEATCVLTAGTMTMIAAGHPFRGSIPHVDDGDVRVVQLRDVSSDGIVNWDHTVKTKIGGWKEPDWLKTGDVLFMYRGTRTLAVHIYDVPFNAVCSPNFYLIRVIADSLLPEFLAWQLNQTPAQSYFRQHAEGSAQLHIRRAELEALQLTVPSMAEQRKVVELANSARSEALILENLIRNREKQLAAVAQHVLQANRGKTNG